MPRQVREEMVSATSSPVITGPVPWGTVEVRHLACPTCSLMARVEFIRRGPYGTYARMQRFGGSLPSPTGKMADRTTYMKWSEPEDLTLQELTVLEANLGKAQEQIKAMLDARGGGVITEPVTIEPKPKPRKQPKPKESEIERLPLYGPRI